MSEPSRDYERDIPIPGEPAPANDGSPLPAAGRLGGDPAKLVCGAAVWAGGCQGPGGVVACRGGGARSKVVPANERTLLAYSRTALAFIFAGLALAGSRPIADTSFWFAALGLPLILLGGVVALGGRRRFLATQRAMRTAVPLGAPVVATLLPFALALIAVVGSIIATIAALAG